MNLFKAWYYLYTNITPSERLLEDEIKKLGERYRCQHLFPRYHHIADFVLLDRKIVIEVDGSSHDLPAQKYKDVVHTIKLEREGFAVVRVTNVETTESPSNALKLAFERLTHRPSLQALEAELLTLPVPPARRAKRPRTGLGPSLKRARRSRVKKAGAL